MSALKNSLVLNLIRTTPHVRKVVGNLVEQEKESWVFNSHMGINFLVLSAIQKHAPELIDGRGLAQILSVLTNIEVQEGGPYYSELIQKDRRLDLGTNVVIGHFLHLNNVQLDSIDQLIDQSIKDKDFQSELFNSIFFTVFFISEFYQGEHKESLINFLLEQQPDSFIDQALIVLSLRNLGSAEAVWQEVVNRLGQPAVPDDQLGQVIYSEVFRHRATDKPKIDPAEEQMMSLILATAEQRFSSLSPEFSSFAMREIKKVIAGNFDKQMSLMPYFTKVALGQKGQTVPDELVAQMGLANIFYWTAFVIYDDFWDEDEAANPQILPVANLYARHYSSFFSSLLPEGTGFGSFFHSLMDRLDAANTWETIYCRTKVEQGVFHIPETVPDYEEYERKYEPASGHVLGPVAMLVQLGYGLESDEVKNFIDYFRCYLIAMQLNDDAHDWEEDMHRGHLSTVVVMLLEDWAKEYPDRPKIDLVKDKIELQKIFWFKTIKRAGETALQFSKRSREALGRVQIFEDMTPLEHYIKLTENAAQQALDEQKKSLDFLKNF